MLGMATYQELVEQNGGKDFPAGTVLPPLTERGAGLLNREGPGVVPFSAGLTLRLSATLTGKANSIFLERDFTSPRGTVVSKVEARRSQNLFEDRG